VGRPPLQVKAMKVRLPDGVPERIDALVGSRRRAEFIREAVVFELERREAAASLHSQAPQEVKPAQSDI
jgi:Arc/MetJ-type ribon-helix-helix transcriptional regulator